MTRILTAKAVLAVLVMTGAGALVPAVGNITLPGQAVGTATIPAGGRSNLTIAQSWLERPLHNWNREGDGLPTLPDTWATPEEKTNVARFPNLVRPAENDAETALNRRGWVLYGPVQSYGQTRVVTAMSGVNTTGKPVGYQVFVYWEGRYAGTLSPTAMRDTYDGALTSYKLVDATTIVADYARLRRAASVEKTPRISSATFLLTRDDIPGLTVVSLKHSAADGTAPRS